MAPQNVDRIAQGRVWDGGTARQIGLVDHFGGLSEAVAHAARLAKLDGPQDVRPAFIDAPLSFREQLAESFRGGGDGEEPSRGAQVDAFSRLAARPDVLLARALADVELILSGPAIQARCIDCAAAASAAPARGGDGRLPAALLGAAGL